MTPESFLSRDGELRDIQKEFSEYVGSYICYVYLDHFSIRLSLSVSLFLNLLFEPDPYSNEYSLAKIGFDTAEDEPFKVC